MTIVDIFDEHLRNKECYKGFKSHNKYDLIYRDIAEEIEHWDIHDFEHLRTYKMPKYLEHLNSIKGKDSEYEKLKFKLKCYRRMNEICITGKNKYIF